MPWPDGMYKFVKQCRSVIVIENVILELESDMIFHPPASPITQNVLYP